MAWELLLIALAGLAAASGQSCTTAYQTAEATADLRGAVSAIQAVGLVSQFNNSALQATIFLPSNSALAALSRGAQSVSAQQLIQVLENGVVLGQALHLAALIDGETLHTVSNKTLKVSKNVGITDVALVDGAPQAVVLGDIGACRSVIHVISGVLQPAAQVPAPGSVAERLGQAAFIDTSDMGQAALSAAAAPGGIAAAAVQPAGALTSNLAAVEGPMPASALATEGAAVPAIALPAQTLPALHDLPAHEVLPPVIVPLSTAAPVTAAVSAIAPAAPAVPAVSGATVSGATVSGATASGAASAASAGPHLPSLPFSLPALPHPQALLALPALAAGKAAAASGAALPAVAAGTVAAAGAALPALATGTVVAAGAALPAVVTGTVAAAGAVLPAVATGAVAAAGAALPALATGKAVAAAGVAAALIKKPHLPLPHIPLPHIPLPSLPGSYQEAASATTTTAVSGAPTAVSGATAISGAPVASSSASASAAASASDAASDVHPSMIEHIISVVDAHPLSQIVQAAPTDAVPTWAWTFPTGGASASTSATASGEAAASSANVVQAASGPLAGPGPAMSAIVMPAPMPADGGMSQAPLAGPSPAASPAVLTAPVQADGRRCWSASQICQQDAGLGDSMDSSADASTIFAFTNKALDAVLSAVNQPLDALLQDTKFVWQVMALHIVPGRVLRAEDLAQGMQLNTLLGQQLTVEGNSTSLMIAPPSSGPPGLVIYSDIPACSAIMHIINAVLEPAAAT